MQASPSGLHYIWVEVWATCAHWSAKIKFEYTNLTDTLSGIHLEYQDTYWNGIIANFDEILIMVAPKVAKKTTSSADNDDDFIKMTNLFQCMKKCPIHLMKLEANRKYHRWYET